MPSTRSTPPVPNPAYDQTVVILNGAGYHRLDTFKRATNPGYLTPEDHFELWAGPKGTLILQVWKDGNGVHVLGTMGLGSTFEDLKAAL